MIRNRDGAFDWWRQLTPDTGRNHRGDRGALAELRRSESVAAAMQQRATIELFAICKAQDERDLVSVALAAAVLAHVRENASGRVARQIGPETPDRPETALFKPLRFRRLLEASDAEECLIVFRRLVAIAGGKANIRDLAGALFDWLHPYRGPETKRRWIFAYWHADPQTNTETQPAEEPVA
jgi:CRISPR system Cascade subunit CasB